MKFQYESFELVVPAKAELLTEVVTGREGAVPFITSVGRDLTTDTDLLLYLNDMNVVDIPYTMKMGFDNFIPWYFQMGVGDVLRGGFRNRSITQATLRFTVQYFYPE